MSLLRTVLQIWSAFNVQLIQQNHLVKFFLPVNKKNSLKLSLDNHAHTPSLGNQWLMSGLSKLLIENCLIDKFLNRKLGKYLIMLLYFVYESKETNFTSF